jgi:GTPase SAR1 family protein
LAFRGGTTGLIKGSSFVGPISGYCNDIYNNGGKVTFACADGEVGIPVQMQGKEIVAIPPKELQCTKPTPPPSPPSPPSPPPSPAQPTPAPPPTHAPPAPPPTPEPTPSSSHDSWHSIQLASASGALILVLAVLCMCGGGYTARQLRRLTLAKRRRAAALGLIDTSKAVTAEELMQKMPYNLVVQVAKNGRQKDITFHTWDFGGQQVYYVMHHLFITEGVYCLCFNMLEALNDRDKCMEYIAFWLNSTYAHVASKDDCSILLVGTHCDIVSDPQQHRAISDALHSQFEQCSFWQCVRQPSPPDTLSDSDDEGLCFFPVDNTGSTDTTGTTSVMETINMLAEQQVHAREEKPLRWLKVLDELQKIQDRGVNYIELGSRTDHSTSACSDHTSALAETMERAAMPSLWEVAFANGVTEPADFDALIDFFDSIGIIKRCHSRSMALTHCEDVIILKPQWLVNVFSAVITCHKLDDPAVEMNAVTPALAIMLSSDFHRFESKAILSARLLRHLWEQKGVVDMLKGVQDGEEREQWEAKFELLLELLLRFDLMFELKDVGIDEGGPDDGLPADKMGSQDSLDGAASEESVDGRRFLVPAMLAETSALAAFLQRGDEAAVQQPLHCYFAFKEGGASLDRGSGGLLPAVVFAKLQARCASWAQSTSNTEPRLTRRQAEVTFGAQQFELNLVQEMCMIEVVLRVYSRPDEIVSLLQHVLIAKILADSFPLITFDINVRDADSGNYLPLQRVRHELNTRRELSARRELASNTSNVSAALETFSLRGQVYEFAQFEAWVPNQLLGCEDDHGSTSHGGLFDFFICAHESDLQFVGKLCDCLRKITGGKTRIAFSSRVGRYLAPGATPQRQGEWAPGKDAFAIANSGVFVPVISVVSLEQWSFEKRAPITRFVRWLAVLMALFAFAELINDGFLALLLSQQQEDHLYLCYTVVLSLTVPTFIHAFVIRQLFAKELRDGKNQAFTQWMQEHQACLPMLFFLGVMRPDILRSLLKSGAFGWFVFQCPLSMRSSRRLTVAGLTTNVLHDLPQLFVSVILLHHRGAQQDFATLFAVGTTLSSVISLVYSLLTRLSADLLLRAMRYSSANSNAHDEGDVDEMLMEYMTALMQQTDRQDGNMESRSIPQSSLKLSGKELPRLIVPLVIDEIFKTNSEVTGRGERKSMAADSMLLHPIGDNQISIATLDAHDQIMRNDLDLVGGGFVSGFTGAADKATVSRVVDAILNHCAVDEERGGTQVFTVQRDRWGRCNAAAKHVVAKLRSISSSRPVQSQSTRERSANTKVRRMLGTLSSLEAGEGDSSIQVASSLCQPLLQNHSEHSDRSSGGRTDSTVKCGGSSGGRTSVNSMVSGSIRSAEYSTADTTSMRSFKTANEGSTASWNAGGGRWWGQYIRLGLGMQLQYSGGGGGREGSRGGRWKWGAQPTEKVA